MLAFVNDRFIEQEKATLGIGDLAIQRGYGVFDFFRTSNQIPLFLDDYLNRFFRSAELLGLQPQHSRQQLKDITSVLMQHNKIADSGFRIILTGGYSPDSYEPATPNLIIIQERIQIPAREKYKKGLRVILHEYRRDVPMAKSINYLMPIYLRQKLVQQNADEMLYHANGCITEFPRANVFMVTGDGTIVTPATGVLHGITRMKVLEVAAKKHKVEEREVTVDEIKNAAEVFLTSTTKRLLPVVSIDHRPVGNGVPGPVTASLLQAFLKMEELCMQAAAKHFEPAVS